jgi:Ca-activated chloride channel family protein
MTGVHFAHPLALALLAVAPALAAIFRYGDTRRDAALAKFGARPAPRRKRTAKRALVIAAVALMVLAIARPVKPAATAPPGAGDVVFLLDVSRSMLSRDVAIGVYQPNVAPSRLRRAKQIVGDIAGRIEAQTAAHMVSQAGGQRLGLIAFAGNAAVLCPLTIDLDYFRETLDAASLDSVTRGGSRIGDALRFALDDGFDDVRRGSKDLVLLTDGGDQDSGPQQAALALARSGIRLTVIGVGDPDRGIAVPLAENSNLPFLYNGAPVLTRLESGELRAIGGAYWEANSAFDAAAVVSRLAARSGAGETETGEEYYPLLLALAAILLALECLISERARSDAGLRKARSTVTAAMALALFAFPIRAQSAAEWIRQGNDAFAIHEYEIAATCYRNAAGILPASPQVQFDLGIANYKAGSYSAAAQAFARAAERATDPKLQAKSLLGEGNTFFRTAAAGDPSDTVHALQRAIELYSGALYADPKLQDAAYNLEIAKKKLEDLKRQRRSDAAKDYATSSMRREQLATSDPNEILKDAKQRQAKRQVPRRDVATDW